MEEEKSLTVEKDEKSLTDLKIFETEKLVLGGGIELIGFKVVDLSSMVIIKKMVGSYVRKFTEKHNGFEKLVLTAEDNGLKIIAELTLNGKEKKVESKGENVFFVLDKVLKEL